MRTMRRWSLGLAVVAIGLGLKLGAAHAEDKPVAAPDEKPSGGEGEGKGKGEGRGKGEGKPREGKGKGKDSGPVSVRVDPAESKVAPRQLAVIGLLAGRKQADVYSKVTGRLASIGPAEGEAVKQGQTLFRVERADPGESFLDAPVVSPLTGWIGRWKVQNAGEQVTPTDAVVTVLDDLALRVTAQLPSRDWLAVKKDTKVAVRLNGEERAGTVAGVAQSADPASGRGSVTVEIPNPKRDWRAGLYATLRFELDPKERLLVAANALVITDQGSYLYIADGDIARRLPVTYDVYDSDTVEIVSGLTAGARVISAGTNLLGDKTPIKVAGAPGLPASGAP